MGQPRPAYSFVAGCPAQFTLLASNPYHDNNRLLFGQSAVVTDAHKRGPTQGSKLFSPLVPAIWYSMCQSYIPYNSEGLNGTHIIREALQKLVASDADLDGAADEKQYRRRVWQLLMGMRGDQKWYSLRFGCWLLSYIFKWLFNGEIFVGDEVLAQLRDMAPTSTFVYVFCSTLPCKFLCRFIDHIQLNCGCIRSMPLCTLFTARLSTFLFLQICTYTQEPSRLPYAELCSVLSRPRMSTHCSRCGFPDLIRPNMCIATHSMHSIPLFMSCLLHLCMNVYLSQVILQMLCEQ